jgi:hypothetical protein
MFVASSCVLEGAGMALEQDIDEIRAAIKAGGFANEAAVSQGIILRLLYTLGWPVYDTQRVIPEYALEGRRVDYALCHPPGKPVAFIEVKMLGQSNGAEKQLFEYAFHKGVQLAVLTDGQEWNFFLPGEQGDYGERRVYKLDVVEREASECVLRLNRYLQYKAVVSGTAIEAAREDYRNASRQRQIIGTLPRAWAQLVSEEDAQLLELLADRVEGLCGYRPDPDTVAAFLRVNANGGPSNQTISALPAQPRVSARIPVPPGSARPSRTIGFELYGQHHSARNALEVLVKILEELTARDSTFPERFASRPRHGRTRRYLSRTPAELYPDRPDLAQDYSRQLNSGWWIGTNYSRRAISRIIELACDVAHLQYGSDLHAELGE